MGISTSLTLEKYFNFEPNTLWWSYAIAIHRISNNGHLFTAATFFWSTPADSPYSHYYYMGLNKTSMATRTPQNKRLNEQNNSVHVRLCIFEPSSAKQQSEMTNFCDGGLCFVFPFENERWHYILHFT